ncbi:hypothetical protein AAL_05644 [Moelleriella libera RCEF 2490]|uniref:Uncharacterized protein n=1 Tax=Moelleriella libera RCEF 2490 TaxID=1081109 RepID=A0A167ZYS9_9HYPO|nr:hypothetical protein AAL_05644 [Moelleriella libera RCEF 2490]
MPASGSGRNGQGRRGRPHESRGRGILPSFFKPAAVQSRSPPHPEQVQEASSSTSSDSPLSSVASSPAAVTPEPPPKPTKAVIGASDEDDGTDGNFSDDSLEDLSCLLSQSKTTIVVAQQQQEPRRADAQTTLPPAKRTATGISSSTPAIIPRRHKFDLKALAKDALIDEATAEVSLRVRASAAEAAAAEAEEKTARVMPVEESIAAIILGHGGPNAQKVLRALQRAEETHSQVRYMFFGADTSTQEPEAPTLPKSSPWRLVTHGSARAREQNLISGLPQTILRKNGGLPDPVFEWLLDALCAHKSGLARHEYCNMIATCPEQVERILTPDRLKGLFVRLGARDMDRSSKTPDASHHDDWKSYLDRDWALVQSLVSLLGRVADQLSIQSAQYALQTLVQLALDRVVVCNMDLLAAFESTMHALAATVPASGWNSFCVETSAFLAATAPTRAVLVTALLCIPISSKRTHDLRRRIALAALFRDDSLAGRAAPDSAVTLRDVITHLDSSADFVVNRDANFAELRASILLLDVVIDDGGGGGGEFDDLAAEKRFNAEVDELADRLREIWRSINDAGMKLARTEAKSAAEWVQQRLLLSVRTRRRVKKSVFDDPDCEDVFLGRQQDYMKKFLKKAP